MFPADPLQVEVLRAYPDHDLWNLVAAALEVLEERLIKYRQGEGGPVVPEVS